MNRSELQFESHNDAAALIESYNPSSDEWDFKQDSPFWSAVKEAHRSGYRGEGRRIAVVDGSFHLEIPRLGAQAKGSIQRCKAGRG